MGIINASDKIMFKNQKKKRKYGNKRNFYIKLNLKDCIEWIHCFLRRADARGSADIIYGI